MSVKEDFRLATSSESHVSLPNWLDCGSIQTLFPVFNFHVMHFQLEFLLSSLSSLLQDPDSWDP